jgi:Notch-like protein
MGGRMGFSAGYLLKSPLGVASQLLGGAFLLTALTACAPAVDVDSLAWSCLSSADCREGWVCLPIGVCGRLGECGAGTPCSDALFTDVVAPDVPADAPPTDAELPDAEVDAGCGDTCGAEVLDTADTRDAEADGDAIAPPVERCNGVDDDGDGQTDEGLTAYADSDCLIVGVCASEDGGALLATATCRVDPAEPLGWGWDCDYSAIPTYEAGAELSCDALDNDCDGTTDEGFAVGGACDGGDPDDCANGKLFCDPDDPSRVVCDEPLIADPTERCDGLDNDCDGATDEDFGPSGSVKYGSGPFAGDAGKVKGQSCGAGACAGGVIVCNTAMLSSGELTCSSLPVAAPDACNAKDDDCDGGTDEDFKAGGTKPWTEEFPPYAQRFLGESCGTGKCAGGTVACDGSSGFSLCSTQHLASIFDNTCDGIDDDCNGETDDLYGPTGITKYTDYDGTKLYLGQPCSTGPCAGVVTCLTKNSLTCNGPAPTPDQTCDAIDQDCDGKTDEGFPGGRCPSR